MRYRYRFENGKHLVRARDEKGVWVKHSDEFPTAEEARKAAADRDAHGNDVTTKEGLEAEKAEAEVKADPETEVLDPHDLTVIPGIGAATADKLTGAGITTLKMLARISQTRAEELGVRDEWIDEAKRLTAD